LVLGGLFWCWGGGQGFDVLRGGVVGCFVLLRLLGRGGGFGFLVWSRRGAVGGA